MKKKISAFTLSPHTVHLDGQGRPLALKSRLKDTYRAARRNTAKLTRRVSKRGTTA